MSELLSRGLIAGQYPRSYPAVDVYAFDANVGRVINVQVKYLHRAAFSSVKVRDLNFDFLVVCRANAAPVVGGRTAGQWWVIPVESLNDNTVRLAQVGDDCLFAWDLVANAARDASGSNKTTGA